MSVPAGPATIRFAGVAEGMVAVSAVVRGLPGGIVEQNRDKKLLSPGALVDGTLGNRVTLKRTDPATGKVTEQQAVIRSGSQGALVVQTEGGIEALQCSGLPEKVIYQDLPGGLFATPVLSVDTVSPGAATVEVTLTYLAAGFDWNADYVVKLGADGKSLDLFSWLTLANGNAESFADAELLVIAGTLNTRQPMRNLADRPQATSLYIQCWPRGSTADGIDDIPPPPPPPPPAPPQSKPTAASAYLTRIPSPHTTQTRRTCIYSTANPKVAHHSDRPKNCNFSCLKSNSRIFHSRVRGIIGAIEGIVIPLRSTRNDDLITCLFLPPVARPSTGGGADYSDSLFISGEQTTYKRASGIPSSKWTDLPPDVVRTDRGRSSPT